MKKLIIFLLITCFVLPSCVTQTGLTRYQTKNVRKFSKQKWRKKRDRNTHFMKEKDK